MKVQSDRVRAGRLPFRSRPGRQRTGRPPSVQDALEEAPLGEQNVLPSRATGTAGPAGPVGPAGQTGRAAETFAQAFGWFQESIISSLSILCVSVIFS